MFARQSLLVWCASALLLQPFAFAQTGSTQIIPSNLPACAQTCPLLQQAVQSCDANPTSASSCFCQSALLQPLLTSTNNVCAPQCADADFTTINTWYRSFCKNPANPGNGQTTTGTTTTSATTTTTKSTPANPATNAAATTSQSESYLDHDDINHPESGAQWWHNHWQWVLMVIILLIGFLIIGVGGSIWWKKRRARREGWNDPRPDMSTWAPSQHSVHDFGSHAGPMTAGTAAAMPAAANGRGKGKGRAAPAAQQAQPSRPQPAQTAPVGKSGKLKKVLGRG